MLLLLVFCKFHESKSEAIKLTLHDSAKHEYKTILIILENKANAQTHKAAFVFSIPLL